MPTDTDAPADKTASTPPWGSDENFDAARAWTLISNLRDEVGTIKAERDSLKASADERAAAEQTDAERAAARATQAEERAKAAERALWTERALRKHPLPEGLSDEEEADFVAFLSGETPEEIERKAARLAALRGAEKTADEGTPSGDQPGQAPAEIPGRPQPHLTPTPGHGGTQPEPFDAAAIAKAARARR